ncbi:hypothetical protein GGR58DRAFT_517740 [Xylaria digitata]|nr:hypothetical protein GGR58DRAFT_517740 [Xylaria digitata]
MSDISRTVEEFTRRSEFLLTVPGDKRKDFWQMDGPDSPYSYTASDVVKFTEANCLATAATNNNEILEFKRKLHADLEANRISPLKGNLLAALIGEYIVWIDHLFFFGVITHPTRREGELAAANPMITLVCKEGLQYEKENDLKGVYSREKGELWLNLLECSGQSRPFDRLLATAAHELVHVYLHFLTRDASAASYLRDVGYNNGHGVQFHELLQFIFTRLFEWMPAMTRLGELAMEARKDLQSALAQPVISDSIARSLLSN